MSERPTYFGSGWISGVLSTVLAAMGLPRLNRSSTKSEPLLPHRRLRTSESPQGETSKPRLELFVIPSKKNDG